jgi:hypothetical protein
MQEGGVEIMSTTSTGAIDVMEGVFVIADIDEETITFSPTSSNKKSANLVINVLRGSDLIDRAYVNFGDEQQLPKLQINKNNTKVYIPKEGKDFAIVSTKSNKGETPVSFKAENNGTYTLNFTNEGVSFTYLHLIDSMTGNDVDLLANPSYTFEARTSDNASRFRLVFTKGGSLR